MVQMYTSSSETTNTDMDINICIEGTLRKLKTNKNKYFVLHGETESSPAKIEYYNSKKHWDNRLKPRKVIYMKTCFSINAYSDSRVKHGLTVFTKEESMQIGFDNEVERDNWLLRMQSLSGSNIEPARGSTASEHNWNVSVSSRKMRFPIEGMFQLCLRDRQTTLVSNEDPHIKIVLPFEVIREYGHKDSEFILDVGRQADTGAGQIWMSLEDPLIAQNIYDIFTQSMNVLSVKPVENFRPTSKSFSYKDKRSAYRRHHPSSMDKTCSRIPTQVAGQVSPFASGISMSTSLSRLQRDRSDSVSSHSTSASISIEELSSSGVNYGSSCCVTPDPRSDSANSHVPLSGDCTDDSSKLSTSSLNSDSSYRDMSLAKQDNNSNFMYIDMTIGGKSDTHGYVDMGCRQSNFKHNLKPLKVTSFVVCDESPRKPNHDSIPPATTDTIKNHRTDQYVPMCRQSPIRNNSPVCHPDFFCRSKPRFNAKNETEDIFAALDFDDRNRAKSFTSSHRPRQSSWSQFLRPRSSSHGQKVRSGALHTNFQHKTEYVDMSQDSTAYVEMHQDKENKYPHTKLLKTFSINERFPEHSASDDDISLHSHENSIKSNTSLDNMSVNSQQSSVYCSSLESEPYIMVNAPQPSKTKKVKPVRVASFIVDDSTSAVCKPSQCSCTLSSTKIPK